VGSCSRTSSRFGRLKLVGADLHQQRKEGGIRALRWAALFRDSARDLGRWWVARFWMPTTFWAPHPVDWDTP
jgi:hypothetical protein